MQTLPKSVQKRLRHLERHRHVAYGQLEQDWNSFVKRAVELWRPKHREHLSTEKAGEVRDRLL